MTKIVKPISGTGKISVPTKSTMGANSATPKPKVPKSTLKSGKRPGYQSKGASVKQTPGPK